MTCPHRMCDGCRMGEGPSLTHSTLLPNQDELSGDVYSFQQGREPKNLLAKAVHLLCLRCAAPRRDPRRTTHAPHTLRTTAAPRHPRRTAAPPHPVLTPVLAATLPEPPPPCAAPRANGHPPYIQPPCLSCTTRASPCRSPSSWPTFLAVTTLHCLAPHCSAPSSRPPSIGNNTTRAAAHRAAAPSSRPPNPAAHHHLPARARGHPLCRTTPQHILAATAHLPLYWFPVLKSLFKESLNGTGPYIISTTS